MRRDSSLTDRNHLNAPSIGRHHTLSEERALIVTGRDSVPVASSIARSIVVGVSVAALEHVSTDNPSVEASSVEAAAMEAATASISSMALGMWSEYGHPAPSLRIKHVLFGAG